MNNVITFPVKQRGHCRPAADPGETINDLLMIANYFDFAAPVSMHSRWMRGMAHEVREVAAEMQE